MDWAKDVLGSLFQNSNSFVFAAGISLVVVATGALVKSVFWKKQQKKLVQVGVVSHLFIYPVKSCKGVSVQAAECLELGLKNGDLKDRHWLVIQEDGHQLTARQEPRLVLISPFCDNGYMCLSAPDMEEILVPLQLPKTNPVKDCRVWGTDIRGRDCGDEVSHWITTFLKVNNPFRLVQFEPDMKPRLAKDAESPFSPTDQIVYPDSSPIMLLSEASVENLNTKLQRKVKMGNFRPCIVVTGCGPHEEDTWGKIQIGTAELACVMCCGRCILSTVDPDTGIMDRTEPLETLKSYRKCDPAEKHIYKNAPLFGQHMVTEKTGMIHVGDPVYKIIE
uniref:MOSC domain-containing protein n=1 Tax=Latimeria chalumnae TaxID=7897 RepID=H3B0W3_LATCH|nr:PREDICTED: mitochondrial amidoxime reducing component 2 [Latimeria chalumnae]XP_006002482.1 PREDICTED: mitochondrial amidoxime reducing component 2 [Latimeria chalumnae]XP_014347760.1 PREDICTED: mitochondrial amidoxime reducing component 2 [Latimeria chalumnae]XP_014347761.1 PREDICTED: mitochondrial amidoxime reducing component 2 [Latimeria chalumnae]|eukprot:XP_006002481.1 PREDICTED: mitochondrial amidoxime reducing component 2 [Latimeria chalumnae]